jgi:membrane-bound ClpP family serine protease
MADHGVPTSRTSAGLWWLAAGVTAVVMVLIGYVYLASGLFMPGWALALLAVLWITLVWYGVRLARTRSLLVLVLPLIGATAWILLAWFGGSVLGWQA